MSKRGGPIPELAIEWSGRGLTAYDPATRSTHPFGDLQTAGATFGGRQTVIGLSRRSVFVRTIRVPNAAAEDVRQILMLRLAELFPVGPAELAVDFKLTDDVNAEGRLAIVVAVPTAELRRIREDARSAGLRVAGVVPVAFGSAAIAEGLKQGNAAIVSRDQEGIGIDIVVDGELRQSRVVPTNSAIEQEVCRTYSVAGIPCGEIVAADGVVLKQPDADVNDSPLAALIDAFPARIGLDLQLPEEVALAANRRRNQRLRTSFLLAVAAAAVLGLVSMDRTDKNAKLDKKAQAEAKKTKFLKDLETKAEADAQKAIAYRNTLQRGFLPAQRLGDVIALFSNNLPPGVWLSGFTVERGKEIAVRGTADKSESITAYMQNLSRQERLRDVKLVSANNGQIDQTPVVQFSISAFPIGNLPLPDPQAKTKRSAPTR